MSPNRILILKNDRGGDLLNSLKCISSLLNKDNLVTIYLSHLNIGFRFLFKKANVKLVNYNLNLFDKIKIFLYIYNNKFDEIYILTPKNYYYYLSLLFRKIKFFAITIEGKKRLRPNNFLRKFLFKYVTISKRRINHKSSSSLMCELLGEKVIDHNLSNIQYPKLNKFISSNLPKDFLFIQYKESFYDKINLSKSFFSKLLNELKKSKQQIVFSSDIENNLSNKFFYDNFKVIDCEKKTIKDHTNNDITYLHKINSEDLLGIIQKSNFIISPHGLITHMCNFYGKKSLNLFNFKINTNQDLMEQKIAFSEWYKNINLKFVFLNNDIDRSIRKIKKNL